MLHLTRAAAMFVSLCTMLVAGGVAAEAADYPVRPIKLIVPWSAGGGMDNLARILEPIVTEKLGKPLTFNYRPGASSSVGISEVAHAKADGYTVTVNNFPLQSTNVALGIGNYKPEDLVPVCMVAQDPTMLVVLKDSPWKTVEEFIAAAKDKPNTLSVGAPDRFGPSHGTALLMKAAGVPINIVPFAAGAGKGNSAFLGGQVQAVSGTISSLIPIKESIRPLMVGSKTRITQFPDVRTSAEVGMPDVLGFCGRFFWVPKGTPEAVINKLDEAFRAASQDPVVQQRLIEAGMEPRYLNHADAVALVKSMQPDVERLVVTFKDAIDKGY